MGDRIIEGTAVNFGPPPRLPELGKLNREQIAKLVGVEGRDRRVHEKVGLGNKMSVLAQG